MRFGEKLSVTRQSKEMTQDELAQKSGVTIATIRKYEQGTRAERVNFAFVTKLARALGVTCEFFADCEDVAAEDVKPAGKKARGKKK